MAQQLLIYAKPNDQRLEWRPANWVQWTDPIDNVPVITCIATTFGEASLRRGRSAVLGSKGCTVIEPRALLVPHASAHTDDRQQIAPFDRRGLRHSRSGDRSGIGCGNGGFHLHRLNRRDRLARSNRSRQLPCTPSRAGAGRGRNDLVHRQVGPHRMTDLADLIGLVGQSVRRVAVLIRIHATVAVPNSLESRKARIAISPWLVTKTFEIMRGQTGPVVRPSRQFHRFGPARRSSRMRCRCGGLVFGGCDQGRLEISAPDLSDHRIGCPGLPIPLQDLRNRL